MGNETNNSYDELGRIISTTNALQHTTNATYDAAGRVSTQTDAKGAIATNHYDGFGRLEKVTDRLQQDTLRFYDSMNRLTSIVDAENKATAYQYNLLGQRTKMTLADGGETLYAYDNAGRNIEITKPSGIKRKFVFVPFSGELDKIEYFDAQGNLAGTDDYSYDQFGRKTGSISRDNVSQTTAYTDLGQVATQSTIYGGQPYTVAYDYDDRGRLIELTYPSGRKATYTRNDRGLLSTISWESSAIENRTYDMAGQLAQISRPVVSGSPLIESRSYDAVGRLTTIANSNVGNASYTYDTNGNKLSETWTGVMTNWSFMTTNAGTYTDGYDGEDRLRNFVQTAKNVVLELDRSNIGNITNSMLGSTDAFRTYSDTHELITVAGNSQSFDVDGNLTDSQTGIELVWDEAGMLAETIVSAEDTEGIEGINQYGYDADQKRTWRKITRNGTVSSNTVFVYAGANCIAEYSFGSPATSPQQEYVYADDIDVLLMIVSNGGAAKYNVTRNQQSSITALIDHTDGSVHERYTYDALGNRTILAPDGNTVRSSSNNPFGFTSRRHDEESGLMYFRARFFDPTTGEFTSQDSLEYIDGMSQYRGYFVSGKVDPSGMVCVEEEDKCGPDITMKFETSLLMIFLRFESEVYHDKGIRDGNTGAINGGGFWGSFLRRNGGDIDFEIPLNSNIEQGCGTGVCSDTVMVHGVCMNANQPNNIMFGFVARMVGVTLTHAAFGGDLNEFIRKGEFEGKTQKSAYAAGWHHANDWLNGRRNSDKFRQILTSNKQFHKPNCGACGVTVNKPIKDWSTMKWDIYKPEVQPTSKNPETKIKPSPETMMEGPLHGGKTKF